MGASLVLALACAVILYLTFKPEYFWRSGGTHVTENPMEPTSSTDTNLPLHADDSVNITAQSTLPEMLKVLVYSTSAISGTNM